MKTKLSAPFSELRGKVGDLVGQQRKNGGVFVRLSAPYAKSGQERSAAQKEINEDYAFFMQLWRTETVEKKAQWNERAALENLSGWNLYLREMEANMNMKNIAYGRLATLQGVWLVAPTELEKFTDGKIDEGTGWGITADLIGGVVALVVDLGRSVLATNYTMKLGVCLLGGEPSGGVGIYTSSDGVTWYHIDSRAVAGALPYFINLTMNLSYNPEINETWQFRYVKIKPYTDTGAGLISVGFYELIVETIP